MSATLGNLDRTPGGLTAGVRRRFGALGAAVLVALIVVFSSVGLADSAVPEDPWVQAGWSGGELPNVSVVLKSISSSDQRIEQIVLPGVLDFAGVESAFVDVLPAGAPVVHLRVSGTDRLGPLEERVAELSAELGGDGELLVGGQLVADAEVDRAIRRATLVAVVPVVIILGFVVGALYGAVAGVAASLATALSAVLGGLIGSSMAGGFDGSLGTTVLPGALVALGISAVITFRLIGWFKHPGAGDSAENILNAVKSQLPDLALVLGSLLAVAAVAAIFSSGWSPAVTVLMGALFGSLATLATVPAFLASTDPMPDGSEFRTVPMRVPDGRDLPVAVVISVGALLLLLGLIAAGTSAGRSLLDANSVGSSTASQIAEEMLDLGGDPAAAIRAVADSSASADDVSLWAAAASAYPGIAWVYTEAGRYEAGELVSPAGESAPEIDALTAILSPAESARSEQTQDTVRALREIDGLSGVSLEGLPIDAEASGSGATDTLWLVVAILALGSGISVFVLIGDVGLSVVAVSLRLLTTAAMVGAYTIIVDGATATELQVMVLVSGVGISLFEVGLLRMIVDAKEPSLGFISDALRTAGGPAIGGLVVLAIAGIGLYASSVEFVSRFGVALTVSLLLETILGVWILRPVVLGEQALRLVRPGYRGRSLMGRKGPVAGEAVSPEWRRVVSGLLREEFRFQTEPDAADLGTVFVENTPLFNELAQHNLRLRENGLRIAGEGPTVVSVKAVNDGDPVTVAITVDHPSRQLLAGDGRLLGVRGAERRDGMLWLAQDPSGRYRIAEAVDMGSGVPLPEPALEDSAS